MFMGYMGKSTYVNLVLLWISVAENQNCSTNYNESFPCRNFIHILALI
jgi:hypothetical protein